MAPDVLIIGAGISGVSAARRLSDAGLRVLVLEEQAFIGGNVRDHKDGNGIFIHDCGPHIFHTDNDAVYAFLSRFCTFHGYRHCVMADIPDGSNGRIMMPVPFDLNSLTTAFDADAGLMLEQKLLESYPDRKSVSVLELMEHTDKDIAMIGSYVYEHIFKHYTVKQWGEAPERVDKSVIARVPVRLDRAGGYFMDKYQGIPESGYTGLLRAMLDSSRIDVETNSDGIWRLGFRDGRVYFDGEPFDGHVIYTGQVDRLFDYRYGRLPYRSVSFVFRVCVGDYIQPCATVNYTMDREMTRTTEFKHFLPAPDIGLTVLCDEYPAAYMGDAGQVPCYPVKTPESMAIFEQYRREAGKYSNLHLLGRLAMYSYLDMDDAVAAALDISEAILAARP